ncbi:cupin domain-containing protein [Halomicrobium salinisoli]|uniref:cupin domain-containing protein n=1 Tax=Halomicrobium salinisoli TaxID=2878391 RepID=UPI001CF07404|nr:cupin domain-containing protein [Halomicrobium salinisoli]
MGYHVVDPARLEPEPDRPSEMRYVSEAADMDRLGLRVYSVDPGEEIPLSGLHYHETQEEAFYVLEGVLSVETPEAEYRVEPDQFFVAQPESPHRAHVDDNADQPARVIGMGAPPMSDGHSVEE